MDMEKIVAHVEKIVENLEGLVCAIGCDSMPSDGAIYVDGEQKVNYISTREALRLSLIHISKSYLTASLI